PRDSKPAAENSVMSLWDMACSSSLSPLPASLAVEAGARPDHPIGGLVLAFGTTPVLNLRSAREDPAHRHQTGVSASGAVCFPSQILSCLQSARASMAWFAARTEQARIAASGPLRPEWAGRSRRQRGSYRHPAPRLGRARWESHTWPCAARAAEIGSSAHLSPKFRKLFSARLARILPAQLRLLGPSDVLVFWAKRISWPWRCELRVAVMAAGAVGGYFGGRMAAAGHDVAFIARGAH